MSLLVARGVTRLYAPGAGVEDVDLELTEGEVVGLIGPNGGGKSTLLLMLAGLVEPSRGSITVQGVPAHELARKGAGKVGLITATYGLYPLLSGWENLVFFGGLFGLAEGEVRSRAAELLEQLGMTEHLPRRVSTYSSGMQQKLSLTRALLMDPALLLLDEPTANLDPVSAHNIYTLLRERADRGLGVMLVTHDLHTAEHVCDRVIAMRGRITGERRFEGDRSPEPSSLLELYGGLA